MKGKMRAQVFYEPKQMRPETVDIPEVGANQVLVRVRACGICGSDVAYYYGRSPLDTKTGKGPLILGHEFSGVVEEVGEIPAALGLFAPGERVLANPVQHCGVCPDCVRGQVHLCRNSRVSGVSADGAFAQYAAIDYTHLHRIPEGVSFEDAALCEPLACAARGVKKLDVQMGDYVVIFGPGSIGLMMTRLIRARGAGRIAMIGTSDYALKKAGAMGADFLINTRDPASPYYGRDAVGAVEAAGGALADRVIVATAAEQALSGALEVSGRGATIVYFGLPDADTELKVPLLKTLTADKSILVSWLAPHTWDAALNALRDHVVDAAALVTHRFPLDGLREGIELMADRTRPEKTKAMVLID
ncbi:zinc-binding dehydrogenase [Bacillota bacterium Meth-B3]